MDMKKIYYMIVAAVLLSLGAIMAYAAFQSTVQEPITYTQKKADTDDEEDMADDSSDQSDVSLAATNDINDDSSDDYDRAERIYENDEDDPDDLLEDDEYDE